MKNKKFLITFASLALLATFSVATAYASGGFANYNQGQARKAPGQQFVADKNFTAWRNQMIEHASEMEQRAQLIRNNATPENFDKLVQAHQLMENGDSEAARKIISEVHSDWGFGRAGGPSQRGMCWSR